MSRFISGILILIIGLLAYYAVSLVAETVEETGLADSWSAAETVLILRIVPAALIFGTMASVFLGIKRVISRRLPPEE